MDPAVVERHYCHQERIFVVSQAKQEERFGRWDLEEDLLQSRPQEHLDPGSSKL
jgi:hypothetical protein